jgi:hypothetical protein
LKKLNRKKKITKINKFEKNISVYLFTNLNLWYIIILSNKKRNSLEEESKMTVYEIRYFLHKVDGNDFSKPEVCMSLKAAKKRASKVAKESDFDVVYTINEKQV